MTKPLLCFGAATLALHGNDLSQDAFETFCERFDESRSIVKASADCTGDNSTVDCSCCTACYNPSNETFVFNLAVGCASESRAFQALEGRNVTCDCLSGGYLLACNESCMACNQNSSICVESHDFKEEFGDYGERLHTSSSFRYVEGRNDEVHVHYNWTTINGDFCQVFVNGEQCDRCSIDVCLDGFESLAVKCDNVEGSSSYDPCRPYEAGIVDDIGPLTFFALQDPSLRDGGCVPWFALYVDYLY